MGSPLSFEGQKWRKYMSRVNEAAERHGRGYNCSQAVACSFAKDFGFDEEMIFRTAEGYGAGMGGMQCTCGAVCGAVMAAGMKNSRLGGQKLTKGSTYLLSKNITEEFKKKNGSVICGELKGVGTGKPLRSCAGCIEDAVRIAEKILGMEEGAV